MQAVYFRAADSTEPVSDHIDRLSPRCQAALDNQIDRLNMLEPDDPPLPFPHSSQVEGELRELRCHYGRELYRILYRRSENLFILLHIIRKTTGAIPGADKHVRGTGGRTSRRGWTHPAVGPHGQLGMMRRSRGYHFW